MPQFPFKPDSSDLPAELFPEVILPDENGELDQAKSADPVNEESGEQHRDVKHANHSKEHAKESKERPPIQFKKRSEAIPLRRSSKRSRSRRSSSLHDADAKNFFADDQSISDFRAKFSKPLTAIVSILWLLGIIYLFKLGIAKSSTPMAAGSSNVAVTQSESPASLQDAYQEISEQLEDAEKLIDTEHNPSAQQRGIALKLKALHDWNVLDLSADREDVEKSNELLRATRRYIGNKNAGINSQAQKGLLFLQVKEYLGSPDEKYWHEVENRFDEVIQMEIENPEDSRNFLRIADAIADRGLMKEAQRLYRLIATNFSGQKDSRLALLGNLAQQKLDQRPSDQVFAMIEGDESEDNDVRDIPSADLVDVKTTGELKKTGVIVASADVPENEITNMVGTAEHENVIDANSLSGENMSSLAPAESNVKNTSSLPVSVDDTNSADSIVQSEVVEEAPANAIDVVMTDHQGDEVALPVDLAPEPSATNDMLTEDLSKERFSNSQEVVSQFLPQDIKRADEPETGLFQPESGPDATESASWLFSVIPLTMARQKNIPAAMESNIDDFLIARDSVDLEKDSEERNRTNAAFDD